MSGRGKKAKGGGKTPEEIMQDALRKEVKSKKKLVTSRTSKLHYRPLLCCNRSDCISIVQRLKTFEMVICLDWWEISLVMVWAHFKVKFSHWVIVIWYLFQITECGKDISHLVKQSHIIWEPGKKMPPTKQTVINWERWKVEKPAVQPPNCLQMVEAKKDKTPVPGQPNFKQFQKNMGIVDPNKMKEFIKLFSKVTTNTITFSNIITRNHSNKLLVSVFQGKMVAKIDYKSCVFVFRGFWCAHICDHQQTCQEVFEGDGEEKWTGMDGNLRLESDLGPRTVCIYSNRAICMSIVQFVKQSFSL